MYRAKVIAGEMTEAEAEAMLNGKSPFEKQGSIPAMMWPTPKAHDGKDSKPYPSSFLRVSPDLTAAVQMWPTPTAQDGNMAKPPPSQWHRNSLALPAMANLWPTPCASDDRDRGNMTHPSIQRRKAKGKQISLSQAQTTPGHLNHQWVEWLMGFPSGYLDETDTPSER
tara:strand:- start:15 stop:518 length:504 start_codon:yes stop_codon:yes gene_type:complete